MAITVLAILFLALIVGVALLGYKTIVAAKNPPGEANLEKCSLCRNKFDKRSLVERQIGDYRLLYFCRECILKLYQDLGISN